MNSVFIIAEAGVNHNGCPELAKKMIKEAKDAGADAVKFQTFRTEELLTKRAEKAEYQKITTGSGESQFDMIKRLELSSEDHKMLIKYAEECSIEFMSSPFDLPSIDALSELGMKTFKVPSGEIVNLPYLRKLASLRAKYIISTGMCNLGEVEQALDVFYTSGIEKNDIILLHATTEYPAPFDEINLRAMVSMGEKLGVRYGYSDHTAGIEVSVAAAALGACVIEKHFTLDKNMEGPDHRASLEPSELRALVSAVRNIEKALGNGIKMPTPSEITNIKAARKSLTAKRDIKKGEIFTEDNLTAKRPGTGVSPMKWDDYIGRAAERDFSADEQIF